MTAHSLLLGIFDRFKDHPHPAYLVGDTCLSYQELHRKSLQLAGSIFTHDRSPVVIWGHKDAEYLVAYWACLITGRAFIPVEPETPMQRLIDIVNKTGAGLILSTTGTRLVCSISSLNVLDVPEFLARGGGHAIARAVPSIDDNSIAYIMSSSGTSGAPKAIQITYANLAHFIIWLRDSLFADFAVQAISGNVRYCFDVSLFELWGAWLKLIPISALDHREFINSRRYIDRYNRHQVGLWVSTPSVVQHYLNDRQFNAQTIPSLSRFLFCGETLSKTIVKKIWSRFPDARIINTYGPTECSVAVTSVEITPDHLSDPAPLPIGYPRTGCELHIEKGEISISGASVGPGYIHLPDRQAAAFPFPATYRTGDVGYCEKATGMWYFQGRNDREIKLQGQRIDLGEIEEQICQHRDVEIAIVTPKIIRNQPRAIMAYVVGPITEYGLQDLANTVAANLPGHMVPRFWYCCDKIQFNNNSKLARQDMIEAAHSKGISYVYG